MISSRYDPVNDIMTMFPGPGFPLSFLRALDALGAGALGQRGVYACIII